jgi:hypothetical protein
MLRYLRGQASDRKLRLFAVACCRKIAHLLTDNRSRAAFETAERFAEGLVGREELWHAEREANDVHIEVEDDQNGRESAAEAVMCACWLPDTDDGYLSVDGVVGNVLRVATLLTPLPKASQIERRRLCRLIREVFGNPFRPRGLGSAWYTPTVVRLAEDLYVEKAFRRMPKLADVLAEAGCQEHDLLAHCRQSDHVRGCWVLDLFLGKG